MVVILVVVVAAVLFSVTTMIESGWLVISSGCFCCVNSLESVLVLSLIGGGLVNYTVIHLLVLYTFIV